MKAISIAIDGYSGCGKSSTAREVAKFLNYIYLDTGAMYRSVTLHLLRNQIDTNQEPRIKLMLANPDVA